MNAIARVNQAAFDVGRLAERLAEGYYAYAAGIQIATDPRAKDLIGVAPTGHAVPVGYVTRKDGTHHVFHFAHYLGQLRENNQFAMELQKTWLVGSLLTVGDALARHNYFDRAPELELLRHLRNGIAHGNKFYFGRGAKLVASIEKLKRHPADNKLAWVRGEKKEIFEICETLQGKPVLFDFMGPANVLDLLMSVGIYLMRLGDGEPLRQK
jgi:hypothetical protein